MVTRLYRAKALREARIEVRIVDPKRVRSFALLGRTPRRAPPIDADPIAWFAETFTDAPRQAYDAARERLVKIVNARQGLLDLQTSLKNSGEHSVPDVVQKMQARLLKKIAGEVAKLETAISAMVKATPHFAELAEIIEERRAGRTSLDTVRLNHRDDAGTGPVEPTISPRPCWG